MLVEVRRGTGVGVVYDEDGMVAKDGVVDDGDDGVKQNDGENANTKEIA